MGILLMLMILMLVVCHSAPPCVLNLPIEFFKRSLFASHEQTAHQTLNHTHAEPNGTEKHEQESNEVAR